MCWVEGRELLPGSSWTLLPSHCDTGHVQVVRKSLFLRPFSVNFSAIAFCSINLQYIISPLKKTLHMLNYSVSFFILSSWSVWFYFIFVLTYSCLPGCPGMEYWILVSASGMFIWGLVSEAWKLAISEWKLFTINVKQLFQLSPALLPPLEPALHGAGLCVCQGSCKALNSPKDKTWAIKCWFGAVPAAEQRLRRSQEKANQAPLSVLAVQEVGRIPTSWDATTPP